MGISFQKPEQKSIITNKYKKEPVDVPWQNYVGYWYEIGSISRNLERDCIGAIATYGPISNDGKHLKINNECIKLNGKNTNIKGNAEIIGIGRLLVSFDNVPNLNFLFSKTGNYIIIDYDFLNGNWSVVSSPDSKYFWILSRDLNFSQTFEYKNLISKWKMDSSFDFKLYKERNPAVYDNFQNQQQNQQNHIYQIDQIDQIDQKSLNYYNPQIFQKSFPIQKYNSMLFENQDYNNSNKNNDYYNKNDDYYYCSNNL